MAKYMSTIDHDEMTIDCLIFCVEKVQNSLLTQIVSNRKLSDTNSILQSELKQMNLNFLLSQSSKEDLKVCVLYGFVSITNNNS